MVKDYYEILQIAPSATQAEIKVAYRKLAHLYHPDKNAGDHYALANFQLVKEAYETLSRPYLREAYLSQRWLNKAGAKEFSTGVTTPETILKMFLDANRKVQNMDAFRSDKSGIAESILHLLSYDNVEVLNRFDEKDINHHIITQALQMNGVLGPPLQERILVELQKIKMDANSLEMVHAAEKQRKQTILMNQWKPWMIGMAVLFFCVLIWALSE